MKTKQILMAGALALSMVLITKLIANTVFKLNCTHN